MIDRYSRDEMSSIWAEKSKYRVWLDVELAVCEAHAKQGRISDKSYKNIASKAAFDTTRIAEIEAKVHHDVIAFLTSIAEKVGSDSRYIHMGMTSSDLLDTSFAIMLKRAGGIIRDDLLANLEAFKEKAFEYKMTPMMGRSHGIFAEPISFGLKFALWYSEFNRHLDRLDRALDDISVGKISGAVGTYAHLSPIVEKFVCDKFGLKSAAVSNQIIQRDRHANFFCVLAGIGSSMEKVALEIRHLQRSEVGEAAEPFGSGQKGSSAMPHKRNPILCENLAGLSRILRANAMAALENVALWHERDISHSSAERVIAPDSTILVDFMLSRLLNVISGLDVFPDKMQKNIDDSLGLYASQDVMLELIGSGMTREDAYALVQSAAMKSWKEKIPFRSVIESDKKASMFFDSKALNSLFDIGKHLKHVDYIFDRVFSD